MSIKGTWVINKDIVTVEGILESYTVFCACKFNFYNGSTFVEYTSTSVGGSGNTFMVQKTTDGYYPKWALNATTHSGCVCWYYGNSNGSDSTSYYTDDVLMRTITFEEEPTDENAKYIEAWLQVNATKQVLKKLTRLYLGDVVKKGTTRQLRKLTPSNDPYGLIGTWVFYQSLIIPKEVTELGLSSIRYDVDFVSNEKNYSSIQMLESLAGWDENWFVRYRFIDETDDTPWDNAYNSKVGDPVGWQKEEYRTINITGGADITNEEFATWLKANATKRESIVGTWTIKPDADYAALAPLLHTNNPNVIRCSGAFNAHSPLTGEAVKQALARIYVSYSSTYDKHYLYFENNYAVENFGQAETARIVFSIGTAERYYTEYDPQGNSGTLAQSLYEFEPTNETYMTFTIDKITEVNDIATDLPLLNNWLKANATKIA